MPWVGVLWLPSMAPPKAGTTCAYLSWSVFFVELNPIPREPMDEPCVRGVIIVHVGM
jgi:hypothetical protein